MVKHRYTWQGVDRLGMRIKGEMRADASEAVVEQLRQQRIRATRVQREFEWPQWLSVTRQRPASANDITQFTRQLATLLHAGVPLLQALTILECGEPQPALKAIVHTLHNQIENGMALHQALHQHAEFDALYCNLVAVGELAGMLDVMLERLANHLEKSESLRTTLRSALVYPCAVLGIAVTVLVLILVFVVPAFENIFASFGAELPWLTRCVMALSQGVQNYGVWLTLVTACTAWWLKREIQRRTPWRRRLHALLLHLPIAGPLTRHACAARWTRTLATMFAAGVPLTEALEAVQGVTGHLLFQSATQTIQAQLVQGHALSQALENTQGLFPNMVVQMCAIGEESGALDHMLKKNR